MANDNPANRAGYHVTRLPNGATVVLRPMPHVESASIGLWIRAGGRYETSSLSGVSHFIEHLLFKGTRTRTCEELKQAIEGVGGSLNAFTAEEFTCYMAKVPAKHFSRAITILSDMVRHPRFYPSDIRKEREVILEEIRMYDDTPAQYVHDLFNQLLWPNHPLGNLLSGTARTVNQINRRDLLGYWKRMYHARNLVISCAGAFDPELVLTRLRARFGTMASGSLPRFSPAPRPKRGPQVHVLRKTTEQAHVCLGTPAIPRTHPGRYALELLHVVLGANMSSRLFREVREKRGLVYEIGTHIKRYKDTGAFVVYAGCDVGKLPTTIRTVIEELSQMSRQPIAAQELRRAKEFYQGQLLMGLEDTMEHMLWMGEQVITVDRVASAHDLVKDLERVTPRDIQRAARAHFTPRRTFLAVIGQVPEQDALALRRLCVPT